MCSFYWTTICFFWHWRSNYFGLTSIITCREQGDKNLASYCLGKAITADRENIDLRLHRAGLFIELGEYYKAAETYEQISRLEPDNIEVLRLATQVQFLFSDLLFLFHTCYISTTEVWMFTVECCDPYHASPLSSKILPFKQTLSAWILFMAMVQTQLA